MNIKIEPQKVEVSVNSTTMGIDFGSPIVREFVERDPYEWNYEVTPSAEVQTLRTKGKRMTDDIVISPVPGNYGLVTWNGSYLVIS